MRRRAVLVAATLAVAAAGCGGGKQPEFGRADAESIRKITQDFMAAYNVKDAAKLTTFFSGSAVLMPPNSSTLRGQDSIKGYYESRFAEGATDLNLEPKDVGGYGTLAYVSGTYTVRVAPPGGGADRRDRGKYLWIFRNLGAQWRSEYEMWSSDLPVPAPPPPPSQ